MEIEFVPAWVDYTEDKYGRVLFLSFSGYDEDTNTTSEDDNDHPFQKTHTVSSLEAGEKEKKSEYYDRIYIGWYDGSNYYQGNRLPYPNVENIVIADDWSNFSYAHFSLRINDRQVLVLLSDESIINMLRKKWTQQTIDRGRNNTALTYAGILCKAGVEQSKATGFIHELIPDLPNGELTRAV